MKGVVPSRAAIRKIPWERSGFLRALIDGGAVVVASDERRQHRLPGGAKSMVRIDTVRLLTRPDPAQAFVGALERFMTRGFDDHVLLANTGAPGSGRLAGALAFSLGVRQAILSGTGQAGGITVRLPDNLWANPASAIVVLADSLTPGDSAAAEAVQALSRTWHKLPDRPSLPPIHVLAGTVHDAAQAQRDLAKYGAALHYIFAVRDIVQDPRLRLNRRQQEALRREFP
jgi:hypothetical protein